VRERLKPFVVPALIIVVAGLLYHSKVRREMVDFDVYRVAAARARAGAPLYRADDGHYQFKYLPAFAMAMAPFAAVDADTAKTIWFAMSVGLLTAYVRWAVRALPERRRSERALIWMTVILMAKFYGHELTLGQTNVLLGTLLVAALLAAQVDQPALAGGLIGVAAFVKPYALVLLPWLGLTYGIAAAGVCLAVVAAGLVLPAAVYGWAGNIELLTAWWRTVTVSTAPNLLVNDNISLAAMWAKWVGPGTAASLLASVSSAAVLGLAAAVWLRRRLVGAPEYLEFALLMLLVPLLSPQGWDYVLLLATPAVICLVDRWSELGVGWRVSVGTALALMCLTIFDLMGRDLYGRFMAVSIVSIAALCLAGALARLRWNALA
jgi:hypothetical protein